jgi:hypothetical protein
MPTKQSIPAFSQILANVYIGTHESVDLLGDQLPGPSLVVNCTPDVPAPKFFGEFVRIPVWDHPEESTKMFHYLSNTRVLEKIHERVIRGEQVLIHCVVGRQRSCAVLACYLCWYYGMSVTDAIEYIRYYRPVAFRGGVNFMDTISQYSPVPVAKPL